jgi:hypothetical protein
LSAAKPISGGPKVMGFAFAQPILRLPSSRKMEKADFL